MHLLGVSGGKATRNTRFQHDGAAVRFARQFREHFTSIYDDRWNEWGGPMAWPPRSPDLTPMDFLCVHIKALIYTSPVDSKEDLIIASIVNTAANIRQQPGMIECSCQSLLRRRRPFIDVYVRTFEHLI
jgi:hypothetical protein